MKAISLWQPWASAIALGHKRVETRHWSTHHRGLLAIHAAKRFGLGQREFAASERALGRLPARLPFGAIVAVCILADVRPSQELEADVGALERLYGNYEWGRFGWMLENIRPLSSPVACVGRQGLFEVDDQLLQGAAA